MIRQSRREPNQPSRPSSVDDRPARSWLIGFLASLALPLGILIAVHEILGIHVEEAQGLQIFLFFSWMTASHAMLTLYRVKKTGAIAQGALLTAITVIAAAYLFAAEVFAHFLYVDAAVVQSFFDAAALPEPAFFTMAAVVLMMMGGAWVLAYRQGHGIGHRQMELRTDLYVLFMNGLYLDSMTMRAHGALKRAVRGLDHSGYVGTAIAVVVTGGIAALSMTGAPPLGGSGLLVVLGGLLLPLFPLHGGYVLLVTRTQRPVGVLASILLPFAGICVLLAALPDAQPELLAAIKIFALGGALYGSLRALAQNSTAKLLSYGALAVHSVTWWHVASVGRVTPSALLFSASSALALGGLLLGWNFIRDRYGDLHIDEIGGLFRRMPILSICISLLVMAAVGLPPFGPFFGYMSMLTAAPDAMTLSSALIFFAWFACSWYMVRLMHRLLFGPHRRDLRYEDLRTGETTALALVIGALLLLGVLPHVWADALVQNLAAAFGGAA